MSRGELASASRLGPRQRTPRATSRLQTAKELHQVGIIPPFQSGVGSLNPWIAGCECLRFHCQVGFSIDISCVYRDVAQPCTDRIDVHARAKEVSSRGVPDGMRAYPYEQSMKRPSEDQLQEAIFAERHELRMTQPEQSRAVRT